MVILIWKSFRGGVHTEYQELWYLENEKKNIPRSSRKYIYFHSLSAGHTGKGENSDSCLRCRSRCSGEKHPPLLSSAHLIFQDRAGCQGPRHSLKSSSRARVLGCLFADLGVGMEGTQLMLRDVSLSGFSEQSGGHHPACGFTLYLSQEPRLIMETVTS